VSPKNRPKLGQHFLHDPNIVRKILKLASLKPGDAVLEIGPGHGILTQALAREAAWVISIELDQNLFDTLKNRLAGFSNTKLICADALSYPLETLPAPLRVVANLPYYIATPLIFRLLEFRARIRDMILMLQREVAERMVTSAGNKRYSPLSIAIQYYTQPSLAFSVSRRCFKPPPRVDSAVVQLKIRRIPSVQVLNESFFFKVVKAGFAHRRKVLKNSIKDCGFPDVILHHAFAAAHIDPNRRAETLSLNEFARLSDTLYVELTSQNMLS
jgi:16S rRNA (adenine1518-N6/adenine1519-N6)-dimethyltransferase